jgi:chromosome segregation ATPase
LTSACSFSRARRACAHSLCPRTRRSAAEAEWVGAQRRQRTGEVVALHAQIQELESGRAALLDDVASLTGHVDQLSAELKARERELSELGALGSRHAAALELIGEQQEELDAVRADLDDVKSEWRRQVMEWCPNAAAPTPTGTPAAARITR